MPSGIRLQQLIQNQYKEILAREKNNDKFIHLYDIGAYWVAFERSACRLSGLFSKSELTLFRVPDCMEYVSCAEVAAKWGISERRVQKLCEGERIPGAVKFSRIWLIPKDAEKPVDGRRIDSKIIDK